eukprot:s1932_g12.t1
MAMSLHLRYGGTMAGIEPLRTTGEEGQGQAAVPGRWRGIHAGWFSSVGPLRQESQAQPRAQGSQPVVNSQLSQETEAAEPPPAGAQLVVNGKGQIAFTQTYCLWIVMHRD